MFDIPSNKKIEKCIITKEVVLDKKEPKLVINENKIQKKHLNKKLVESKEDNKETA